MNPFLPERANGATSPPTVERPAIAHAPVATDDATACVYLVADDPAAATCWCESLQVEGMATRYIGTLPSSYAAGSLTLAVVLLVSRRLPDQLGALRQLRARDVCVPLVVVCQALRDLEHVLALEMGADDVLDAATPAAVVAARLRALARRCSPTVTGELEPDVLAFGALSLHLRERRVRLQGSVVALTEGEFEVLWLLASQAGRAVSRADLLRRLRGLPYQRIDRSIDCRIYRLRAKLGDTEGSAQRIRTVRNCGYLFSSAAW